MRVAHAQTQASSAYRCRFVCCYLNLIHGMRIKCVDSELYDTLLLLKFINLTNATEGGDKNNLWSRRLRIQM